jgi:phage-related protein
MKPLRFLGSSLDDLRDFPDEARRAAGFELRAVQDGLETSDWKSMSKTIVHSSGYVFTLAIRAGMHVTLKKAA